MRLCDSRNLEENFQDFLFECGWFMQPHYIKCTRIRDGVWSPSESGLHSPESESELESQISGIFTALISYFEKLFASLRIFSPSSDASIAFVSCNLSKHRCMYRRRPTRRENRTRVRLDDTTPRSLKIGGKGLNRCPPIRHFTRSKCFLPHGIPLVLRPPWHITGLKLFNT